MGINIRIIAITLLLIISGCTPSEVGSSIIGAVVGILILIALVSTFISQRREYLRNKNAKMETSKTAMQQLIDAIDSVNVSNASLDMISTAHFIKMKAVELRDTVEKQQIVNARQDGHESTYVGCESGCGANYYLDGSNDKYYNETYTNENDLCECCGKSFPVSEMRMDEDDANWWCKECVKNMEDETI